MGIDERIPQNRVPYKPRAQALRNDFSFYEFDSTIEQYGLRVRWEQASACACSNNDDTDQPLVNCPVCFGLGLEYHTPAEIRAIVDGLDLNADFAVAFGQWVFGSARFTVRPEHRLAYRHRLTLVDSVMEYTERRRRTGDTVDRLRFPIATTKMDLIIGGTMRPQVAFNVLRLRPMDAASRTPAPLIHRGEDFEVVDGCIDWRKGDIRGTTPARGQLYAVTYYRNPSYLIENFPNVIRDVQQRIVSPIPDSTEPRSVPIEAIGKLEMPQGQARGGEP